MTSSSREADGTWARASEAGNTKVRTKPMRLRSMDWILPGESVDVRHRSAGCRRLYRPDVREVMRQRATATTVSTIEPLTGRALRSRLLRETVKRRRILDENALARGVVRHPFGQQVKEHGVIRFLVFFLGRMRPIARPHHPLRRCLGVCLRELARIRIAWRADFRILVRAREFDPGPALVDQFANDSERGMIGACGLRNAAQVIKDNRRGKLVEQILDLDDLIAQHVDLHVPAERIDSFRERFEHLDGGGARLHEVESDSAQAGATTVE